MEGREATPVAQLYLGLVSTAVYNAVVTVEGGGRAHPAAAAESEAAASSDVAAATAAHDVLRIFFPASAAALDTDYALARRRPRGGGDASSGLQAPVTTPRRLSIASRDGRRPGGADHAWPGRREPHAGMWVPTGQR